MKRVCKHPSRQGKHIRQAVDYLRRLGATAIEVLHNKHMRLAWCYRGMSFAIALAVTARSTVTSPIWAIRSKLRHAGFAVPEAALV